MRTEHADNADETDFYRFVNVILTIVYMYVIVIPFPYTKGFKMIQYESKVSLFKALSDPNRLMIVDMLSCGELCACKILEKFHITQPTLSHHMKTLCDCGLVKGRKVGKWMHYSLDKKKVQDMKKFLRAITTSKERCICKDSECT